MPHTTGTPNIFLHLHFCGKLLGQIASQDIDLTELKKGTWQGLRCQAQSLLKQVAVSNSTPASYGCSRDKDM